MAELKTRPGGASVTGLLGGLDDPRTRADCKKIGTMMREATGSRPKLWGSSIVGYGSYSYSNTAGKGFEWMLTGYSPRKRAISVYIMTGFSEFGAELARLGKHRTGKSCLYIRRLADVDEAVLGKIIRESVARLRRRYDTA
jgi:hypothetical protein